MKPFDEIFADRVREVFDLYSEIPDPMAWETMKGRLERTRRQRVIAMLPLLSRAAAILIIAGIFALLFTDVFMPGSNEQLAVEVPSASIQGISEPGAPVLMSPETATSMPRSAATLQPIPDAAILAGAGLSPQGQMAVAVAIPSTGLSTTFGTPVVDGRSMTTETVPFTGIVEAVVFEPSYENYLTSRSIPDNGRSFSWGLTAGSMMTYAEQQVASGMGFSGGLVTEWEAMPRIRLSSGMLLAYQQFEVEGMPLRMISNQEIIAGLDYNGADAFGDHEYEFLALDIPLNVQFNLGETRRSKLFVSAGVSSLFYLQQKVSGYSSAFVTGQTYNPATGEYQPFSQYSEVYLDDTYDILTRFDIARLLNLSFGYVIKGNNHSTVIEPFIKYPLGTISTRELKMGMGGVTVKYRFGSN
jgi:hypothetical protein